MKKISLFLIPLFYLVNPILYSNATQKNVIRYTKEEILHARKLYEELQKKQKNTPRKNR